MHEVTRHMIARPPIPLPDLIIRELQVEVEGVAAQADETALAFKVSISLYLVGKSRLTNVLPVQQTG